MRSPLPGCFGVSNMKREFELWRHNRGLNVV
nr:MAG TPA: hypothetical protein [Caudoviricetes sp.]